MEKIVNLNSHNYFFWPILEQCRVRIKAETSTLVVEANSGNYVEGSKKVCETIIQILAKTSNSIHFFHHLDNFFSLIRVSFIQPLA